MNLTNGHKEDKMTWHFNWDQSCEYWACVQ